MKNRQNPKSTALILAGPLMISLPAFGGVTPTIYQETFPWTNTQTDPAQDNELRHQGWCGGNTGDAFCANPPATTANQGGEGAISVSAGSTVTPSANINNDPQPPTVTDAFAFWSQKGVNAKSFLYTNEYKPQSGQLESVSWDQRDSGSDATHLAFCVGGQWYVSEQSWSNNSSTWANTLVDLADLTFVDIGVCNQTLPGGDPYSGPGGALPAGQIDAFGFWWGSDKTANSRVDNVRLLGVDPIACAILGDNSVVIGGGSHVNGSMANICSNGALQTAAAARIEASLLALGDVHVGSGARIGADVLANGNVTTGVQVGIGEADGPGDLDVDSGGSILLATGSGAEGTCEYAVTIDGFGACGNEVPDPDAPLAGPFVLPVCDATGLAGGVDIQTPAKSDDYTAAGLAGALPAGSYGNVTFASGNQVELAGGEYDFLSLRFGAATRVKILGAVAVRVQDDLHFANGVTMELASGVSPDQIIWLVDGTAQAEPEHRSGAKTVLYGTFCGPDSTIVFGSGSDIIGAIVAKNVVLGPNVNFTFEPAPSVFTP